MWKDSRCILLSMASVTSICDKLIMRTFLYRWPDASFSLIVAKNSIDALDLLDEVALGELGSLVSINPHLAIHFKLKDSGRFELDQFSEKFNTNVLPSFYPALTKSLPFDEEDQADEDDPEYIPLNMALTVERNSYHVTEASYPGRFAPELLAAIQGKGKRIGKNLIKLSSKKYFTEKEQRIVHERAKECLAKKESLHIRNLVYSIYNEDVPSISEMEALWIAVEYFATRNNWLTTSGGWSESKGKGLKPSEFFFDDWEGNDNDGYFGSTILYDWISPDRERNQYLFESEDMMRVLYGDDFKYEFGMILDYAYGLFLNDVAARIAVLLLKWKPKEINIVEGNYDN
jgi:hypothetical protein